MSTGVATTPAATLARPTVEAVPMGPPAAGIWSNALHRLMRDRVTLIASAVLILLLVLAALADVLANNFFHYSFTRQDLLNGYEKPNFTQPAFWFGTDDLGRSQIVRLLYGARCRWR